MPNISSVAETCPYLGLHDDPGTSLAYPSAWNYCYRARPAASVNTSHQVGTCLSRNHVDCPVYLADRERVLPSGLRGSSTVPAERVRGKSRKSRVTLWTILLLAGLLLAGWWGRPYLPFLTQPSATQVSVTTSTDVPSPTNTIPVEWTNPALIVTVALNTPTSRASQTPEETVSPAPATSTFTRTPIPSRTPTASRTSTKSPALLPGTCGHALDEQFGTDVKFVIHRVAGGENADLYASKYQTNLEAIKAVNFSLHIPLWADEVIVIIVGTTDTRGIPPFEPYQSSGETMSLDGLAQTLNTDVQSLKKYNAFDDTCKTFVNWLLIPRERP